MTISVGEIPRSCAVRDTGSSSPTSSRAVPNKRTRLMDSSPSSDGSFHDGSLHLRFRHRRPPTYRLNSPAGFPPEQPLRAARIPAAAASIPASPPVGVELRRVFDLIKVWPVSFLEPGRMASPTRV